MNEDYHLFIDSAISAAAIFSHM